MGWKRVLGLGVPAVAVARAHDRLRRGLARARALGAASPGDDSASQRVRSGSKAARLSGERADRHLVCRPGRRRQSDPPPARCPGSGRLVARVDRVQRVVHGEVHHRGGAHRLQREEVVLRLGDPQEGSAFHSIAMAPGDGTAHPGPSPGRGGLCRRRARGDHRDQGRVCAGVCSSSSPRGGAGERPGVGGRRDPGDARTQLLDPGEGCGLGHRAPRVVSVRHGRKLAATRRPLRQNWGSSPDRRDMARSGYSGRGPGEGGRPARRGRRRPRAREGRACAGCS